MAAPAAPSQWRIDMGKLRFLLALWLGKLSIPALKEELYKHQINVRR